MKSLKNLSLLIAIAATLFVAESSTSFQNEQPVFLNGRNTIFPSRNKNNLLLIEETSNQDLSKDIQNFEVTVKNEDSNPLDDLSSQSSSIQSSTNENQSEKDENMMKNTNTSKYNEKSNVLGGQEQTGSSTNDNNTTTSTNTSTTGSSTSSGTNEGESNKDYEEKTKVFHSIPDTLEPTFNKTEPRNNISSFYSIIFVGVLCTFALLIITLRNLFQKYFELYILNTLKYILMYSFEKFSYKSIIFRDIIILISVVTMIELLYYHGIFDSLLESIDIYGICLGFSMFAMIWLLISSFYTIIFQFFINKWNEHELLFNQQDVLLNQFTNLMNRKNDIERRGETLSRQLKKELNEKCNQVQYLLMRQSFIVPSFLPPVGESFLRDDFNFSEYLGRVLSKVFTRAFVYSISSFIFILGFIYLWTLFSLIPSHTIQIVYMEFIPLITFLFLILIYRRINIIKSLVIVEVKDVTAVSFFATFTQKRDPFLDFNQPIPIYLDKEIELEEKKIQNSLLGGIKIPNKHEKLFPLASPLFTLKCVTFCLLSLILWIILAFFQHINMISSSETAMFFFVCSNILSIICITYLIPFIIKEFAIASNIGMLKDQKIIQEVVISQRNLITPRFAKLYRLLKSIRKELIKTDENGNLDKAYQSALENQMNVIRDHIDEYFSVLPTNQNGNLEIMNLIKLTHLCGQDLALDELVFLAREASLNDQEINRDSFLKAIFLMAEDVKLDPYKTSKEILYKMKIDGPISEINEKKDDEDNLENSQNLMTISQFKKILEQHKMMSKEDIDIILNEVYYISEDGNVFTLDRLACLIRDSIEGLAR